MTFIYFLALLHLQDNLNEVLEADIRALFLILGGKHFSPLSKMLAVGFSIDGLHEVEEVTFYS